MDRFGSGEKVGVMETAAEFFKKHAGDKTGDRLMEFLHNASHVPPEPEDGRYLGPAQQQARLSAR
jgi:hypothetical protein